jgi:hypothetical protein
MQTYREDNTEPSHWGYQFSHHLCCSIEAGGANGNILARDLVKKKTSKVELKDLGVLGCDCIQLVDRQLEQSDPTLLTFGNDTIGQLHLS